MTHRRLTPVVLAGAVLAGLAVAAAARDLPVRQDAPSPAPRRVEVRVHVTAGPAFQDDLRREDFRLTEEGRPQAIQSLALVRGGALARYEGYGAASPRLERSYTLLFQAVDWDPMLNLVIKHLFDNVLRPGDSMTLITPFKPYQLQKGSLAQKSKKELSEGMEEVLRKDITRGGGEYRDLLNDLRRLTRAISGSSGTLDEEMATDETMDPGGGIGLEMQIERYRTTLLKLDGIRLVDQGKLEAFAESLRATPGQKTVVFFYQREYRPEISAATMNRLMAQYQQNFDILQNLMDLFQFYKREKTFDAERVKRAFADAGIDFHFIFMERKSQRVFGTTMREQSEDTYPGFVEIAKATGGTYASSQNPAASFKRAADASNDYYVLTYVPDDDAADGRFRTIEVQVGRPGCRVSNSLGYYAR
ncbi:MAG TPA: VWA domain-containing protein [Candidatus Aminicenantes bacterium]|nr:VWA domain-containing protein [Candidatus Aminicenantes bacterium]